MLTRHQIESLLPHQGKMFLIDGVRRYDKDEIDCLTVTHQAPGNPLRHAGQLLVHAGIEYAAQASGLHGGLLNRDRDPNAETQMGYLAVVSQVEWQVERLDTLEGPLEIHSRRVALTPGGRLYRFRIGHQGDVVMQGELVIALELR
jgi:predicted hotdog family 3-hydroxylacyl-ACP dehydratase